MKYRSIVSGMAFAAVFHGAGCMGGKTEALRLSSVGNPDRGEQIVRDTGCGACHTIPGIRQAHGEVGPPLTAFAKRTFIAGQLPNTPDHLIQWVMKPHAVRPRTAMPDLGLAEADARDVASFLYTLD